MATVRAFRVAGLQLWFWSNDHEPPHFHAKKAGQWEVKVYFLLPPGEMIEVQWCESPPSSKSLGRLCLLAEQNRAALLEEWEQVHA
jgi:hypothetical protein